LDVIVYTKPGCENSQRIKTLLYEKGVAFREHVCADGQVSTDACKADGISLQGAAQAPVTIVDGVVIEGMDRAQIEQAIGWIGF
jgi:glutaredoxin